MVNAARLTFPRMSDVIANFINASRDARAHAALRLGRAVGPGLLPGLLEPLAGTTGAGPYRQVGLSVPP
jgi:hypothetical protein